MDIPPYDVKIEMRNKITLSSDQSAEITNYVAPMLAKMLEKSRPTVTPPKWRRYGETGPWEVTWSEVDDVQAEVLRQLRRTDSCLMNTSFSDCLGEALAELAERHPKELEGFLVENFLVRSVRNIHKGVGPSEPRASSKR